MKIKHTCKLTALALLALSTLNSQFSTARAQTPAGTVFTYDGKLQYGGSPVADGLYDFQFNLSNEPTGGSQVGSTLPKTAVPVTNGLFTITLDFGAVFAGNATWLAISVCSNGVGNFQSLAPLQELTPTPSAIFAESSSNVSGTVSAAQLTSVGNTAFPNLYNFFIGPAGNPANTGGGNTAIGSLALLGITSGSGNTASGFNALGANGSGSFNTADGSGALQGNMIGSYKTRPKAGVRSMTTRAAPTTSRWVLRLAAKLTPAVPTLTSATLAFRPTPTSSASAAARARRSLLA